MPFSSLAAPRIAHSSPDTAPAGWYWERRSWKLRRILESGGWSIHDVVNRPDIRRAVSEQWRLSGRMEQDRRVTSYILYLEYQEAISDGVLPLEPGPITTTRLPS
jgi:hypothetical protein